MTQLDAGAHNAIIARWAWYAFRDNHVTRHPEDDQQWWSGHRRAIAAAESVIDEQTLRLLNSRPAETPQQYAERLLTELRTALAPYPLQAGIITRHFRIYLRKLTQGDCDPIRAICVNAAEIAVRLYRRRAVKVPAGFTGGLRVRIDHGSPKRRSSFPSPFQGHAVVTPGCSESCCASVRHAQTLQLTLATDDFDEDTLSALPFVLFHECISHVMQGPWRVERELPHPDSQFAEGWMDLAAWTVYEQVLNADQSATGKLPRLMSYRHRQEMFRRGGSLMYDARHAPLGDRAASSRREGWQAATDTLQAMREFGIPDERSVFLSLSFRLNASDLSPSSRDTVSQKLGYALQPKITRQSARTVSVLQALSDFAQTSDLDVVLDAVK